MAGKRAGRRVTHLPRRGWRAAGRVPPDHRPASASPPESRWLKPLYRLRGWPGRLLLLLVLLLLLFGLIVPYQAGIRLDRALQTVQTVPGARVTRLDHGLYHRDFLLRLPVPGSEAPLRLRLTLDQYIGWFLGFSWARLTLTTAPTSRIQLLDWQQAPLVVRGGVGLLGDLVFSLPNGADRATGTGGRLRYDPLQHRLHGHLDLAGLRILAPRQKLLLGGVHVDLDGRLRDLRRLKGEMGLDIRRLGLQRAQTSWLIDGMHVRLRQTEAGRADRRDLDANLSVQAVRQLDAPAANGGRPVMGPSALTCSITGARATLLPALRRLIGSALPAAGSRRARPFSWSRYWDDVRGGALPDLLTALGSANTRVAPLDLALPDGRLHLRMNLVGPAANQGQWRAEGAVYVDPAILHSAWRRTLAPLLSALKTKDSGRAGTLALVDGQWRVNGRRLDYRRLLPAD